MSFTHCLLTIRELATCWPIFRRTVDTNNLPPLSLSLKTFWATVTSNCSPYATRPLSVLSVCPVCMQRWCIVPNGWMDQDATWYGGRPQPRPHCVRRGPSSHGKGHSSRPPTFRPMSIVAKRSPISETAELWFVNLICDS